MRDVTSVNKYAKITPFCYKKKYFLALLSQNMSCHDFRTQNKKNVCVVKKNDKYEVWARECEIALPSLTMWTTLAQTSIAFSPTLEKDKYAFHF